METNEAAPTTQAEPTTPDVSRPLHQRRFDRQAEAAQLLKGLEIQEETPEAAPEAPASEETETPTETPPEPAAKPNEGLFKKLEQALAGEELERVKEALAAPLDPKRDPWPGYRRKSRALAEKVQEHAVAKRELEQTREQFTKEREEARAQIEELANLKKLAKEDPAQLVDLLGLDYTNLTVSYLKNASPEGAEERTKRELQKLREEFLGKEKLKEEEAKKAQETNALEQRRAEDASMISFVKAGNYKEIKLYDDADIAHLGRTVAERLVAQGDRPTYEKVAQELERLLSIKHNRIRTTSAQAEPPRAAQPEGREPKPTLTNRVASKTSGVPAEGRKTREQRIAEAGAILKGLPTIE